MFQQNDQKKSSPFLPQVLMLEENPSKENIATVAQAYAQMTGEISREEARIAISVIQEAEARNSRSVGESLLQLIDRSFDNIRWHMVRTC